jgi:hypothetical protein
MIISDEMLKLVKILLELHFVRVVGLGGCGILETLLKALILSKSLNKRKLDSLAYSCLMRVFAFILILVLKVSTVDFLIASIRVPKDIINWQKLESLNNY